MDSKKMVVENLTQRDNELREELENIVLIKKHLEKTAVHSMNTHLSDGRRAPPQNQPVNNSVRAIGDWLNKNGHTVMAIGKISQPKE